jgi:chromate transporter
MNRLVDMVGVFALLSVLAIGGGTPILPEMQYLTVERFHWLTDRQFRDIYSIGQVAPGPNMLMVLVIGYRLKGALGALAVGLAFFLPDCIITLFANRLWERYRDSPWRASIHYGMAPVIIGLMLSGTYAIAVLSIHNLVALLIAASTLSILMWRHVNPGVLIVIGGVLYALLAH